MSEIIFQDISLNSIYLNNNNANDYLVGEIIMWPNTTNIPYNLLSCNGQELSKTSYFELFNIIGTKYGENGNNFKLPNLNNNGLDDSNSLLIKGISTMAGTSSVSNFQNNIGFYHNTNYSFSNNKININQIPSHNHNIINSKSNISYNIALDQKNKFRDGNQEVNHANKTDTVNGAQDQGGEQHNTAPTVNHTHNISFIVNSLAKSNASNVTYQDSLNHTYNISLNNNITNQLNYKPIHTKVNYLICYTK